MVCHYGDRDCSLSEYIIRNYNMCTDPACTGRHYYYDEDDLRRAHDHYYYYGRLHYPSHHHHHLHFHHHNYHDGSKRPTQSPTGGTRGPVTPPISSNCGRVKLRAAGLQITIPFCTPRWISGWKSVPFHQPPPPRNRRPRRTRYYQIIE